jgi:hypothetical protein
MVVKASTKNQVSIPKLVRKNLNIKKEQKYNLSEINGSILLTPIPEDPVEYLYGILENEPSLTKDLLNERQRDLANE